MTKMFGRMAIMPIFILILSCGFMDAAIAEQPGAEDLQDMSRTLGGNPQMCSSLQAQIDAITAIFTSGASDDAKVGQLSAAIAKYLENMKKTSDKDSEIADTVKQYVSLMELLLESGRQSATGPNKQVSPETVNELKKLKVLSSNYMKMTKIICPGLKLPEIMDK